MHDRNLTNLHTLLYLLTSRVKFTVELVVNHDKFSCLSSNRRSMDVSKIS